ncbi:MAG: hypothetical protein IPK97_16960 [Ahniella sp.]|nr:hypothetical protein [Ahniella sp.]
METLAGDFQILPYEVTAGGDGAVSDARAPCSLDQANAALKVIPRYPLHRTLESRVGRPATAYRPLCRLGSAKSLQEERANAERAAAEHQEQTDAQALIAGNDADKICAASWTAKTSMRART